MTQPSTPEAKPTSSHAGKEALDQAEEYDGIFAWLELTFDDGDTMKIPPPPDCRLFETEEQLIAYDDLVVEKESFDRQGLPERTVKDDEGNEMTLPADPKKGPLVWPPYRKDGVPVKGYEARVVRTALGDEKYDLLLTKMIDGHRAGYADVHLLWTRRGEKIMEREASDPKSKGSAGDLAAVAATDSE